MSLPQCSLSSGRVRRRGPDDGGRGGAGGNGVGLVMSMAAAAVPVAVAGPVRESRVRPVREGPASRIPRRGATIGARPTPALERRTRAVT